MYLFVATMFFVFTACGGGETATEEVAPAVEEATEEVAEEATEEVAEEATEEVAEEATEEATEEEAVEERQGQRHAEHHDKDVHQALLGVLGADLHDFLAVLESGHQECHDSYCR